MLDKQSTEILKYISQNSPASKEKIKSAFQNITVYTHIEGLLNLRYIKGNDVPYIEHDFFNKTSSMNHYTSDPYKITAEGKSYLEELEARENQETLQAKEKKKNNLRENINTILAALALIVAVIALFCD